jgi:hypothetical protein
MAGCLVCGSRLLQSPEFFPEVARLRSEDLWQRLAGVSSAKLGLAAGRCTAFYRRIGENLQRLDDQPQPALLALP